VGARHRVEQGRIIERTERPQVDDLDLDTIAGELLGGLQGDPECAAVGDQRGVATWPADDGLVDVDGLRSPTGSV
jgi:hypothetical protein